MFCVKQYYVLYRTELCCIYSRAGFADNRISLGHKVANKRAYQTVLLVEEYFHTYATSKSFDSLLRNRIYLKKLTLCHRCKKIKHISKIRTLISILNSPPPITSSPKCGFGIPLQVNSVNNLTLQECLTFYYLLDSLLNKLSNQSEVLCINDTVTLPPQILQSIFSCRLGAPVSDSAS